MPKTLPRGGQILDGSIQRSDLDAATSGEAVVRKIVAGVAITLGSTGPDAGTGDVTVNLPTSATPQLTRLGLGQAADSSAVLAATGQYFSARSTAGSVAFDFNNGNAIFFQLASGGNTITLANPKAGARYILEIKQPSSGAAGTVTWPSTVKWSGGNAPVLTTQNSRTDIITLYYNGTNYAASILLNVNI